VNAAQEATANAVLARLRAREGWPERHGEPKRGGLNDASFDGSKTARVLVTVDSRRVALFELDQEGRVIALELDPRFRTLDPFGVLAITHDRKGS
jgi:hypothetical protein